MPFDTPLYEAGIDEGDVIVSIDGRPTTPAEWSAISRRKPGETVTMVIRRRDGKTLSVPVTVKPDPALQVIPIERTGAALTAAQTAFRQAWLGTKVR